MRLYKGSRQALRLRLTTSFITESATRQQPEERVLLRRPIQYRLLNRPVSTMHFKRPTLSKVQDGRYGFPNTGAVMGFLHHYEQTVPARVRNDMVATLGEFVGTFLWLMLAFAICQVANIIPPGDTEPVIPTTLRVFYIGLGFSVSLAITCWLFYRVSGGMFNPAVWMSTICVSPELANKRAGHVDPLSGRCLARPSVNLHHHCTNCRRHHRSRHDVLALSWPNARGSQARWWYLDLPRCIH